MEYSQYVRWLSKAVYRLFLVALTKRDYINSSAITMVIRLSIWQADSARRIWAFTRPAHFTKVFS
ncbi:MAG: hypothetical protein WAM85_16330 [Terracidiphilus sp.]